MDPGFPKSACWDSLEIMDPSLRVFFGRYIIRSGSIISKECLLVLFGNDGSILQLCQIHKLSNGSMISKETQQALFGNHGSITQADIYLGVDPSFPKSACWHSLDMMDPFYNSAKYISYQMDPLFPKSPSRHSLEIMDPFLGSCFARYVLRSGSIISKECLLALFGNDGSIL